jgi:hypothetical protein
MVSYRLNLHQKASALLAGFRFCVALKPVQRGYLRGFNRILGERIYQH